MQAYNIYDRLYTCIFMLVPVSTTSIIFLLYNMSLNFQTGSAGSAGEPIQNVSEMLLPSHDMLFPSTAFTPHLSV